MRKRVYSIWLLVVALVIGAWVGTNRAAAARPALDATSACDHASTFLVGATAQMPRAGDLIHDMCDFRVRLNDIPSNASEFDRLFIENAIAANTLEIQSLQFALERATNEEWRGLIQMMITMHTSDLEMAMRVAEKIGVDTTPNLSNARVYPGTPDYDLGKRRIDLIAGFLDPLMAGAGPATPTAIPTDLTGSATVVPPDMTGTAPLPPVDTPTGTDTSINTGSLGRFVALQIDTPTATFTATATSTATLIPTDTATGTASETATATALPTDTATATETETATATAVPTDTGTVVATDTATAHPTDTATATATLPPIVADFDLFAMEVIQDEHVMDVEVALAAERLVENDEVRAFAKHTADVAHLHLMLMRDLEYRLAYNIVLPPPRFQADYQSPRRFEPR